MVSRETKVSLAFVVAGVALWYLTYTSVENDLWAWVVLITVGVLVPTVINERLGSDSRGR